VRISERKFATMVMILPRPHRKSRNAPTVQVEAFQ
jgi:hypothetical protein